MAEEVVLGMLRLRSCPRCKMGDITVDRDHYGWYEYCIQCGYMRDLVSVANGGQPILIEKKRPIRDETLSRSRGR